MANAAPCQGCLQIADAEFCVTNRLAVPWPFEQPVINLCVTCLIQLGITMGEALQAAMDSLEQMATPEELEQIHANDPEDVPAPPAPKSRKRTPKKTPVLGVTETVIQEAPDDEPTTASVGER